MAFLAFCLFLASAAAQNVRPSTNLSSGGAASFDAIPATSGDMSVVCQVNETNAVVCYTSDGRGLTWKAPVQVDSGASAARKDLNDPSYVAFGSGSNLYCIWEDRRIDGSTPHLFFNSSADGGASWGTEAELFAADITGARMNVSPGTPDTIYISVGCNDGESGSYTVSFDDGSSETMSGSCGSTTAISQRLTNSMTIYMNSGGGSDNHISFTCCGSSGWGVYYK